MSIAGERNEFDGDWNCDEHNLQWSPFKEYKKCNAVEINLDHDVVNSLIQSAFPIDQEQEKELQCKKLPLHGSVQDLTSFLYGDNPCSSCNENVQCSCSQAMLTECKCVDLMRRQGVCKWKGILHSFFQKKPIKMKEAKWRKNFFDALSLDLVEMLDKQVFVTSKKSGSLSDTSYCQEKVFGKPDPIYSNFGKLRNGFYVSSNGVVFSSENEAKAEERKLLSQRTESHEESDQDDEPRENQQLNKESKPKDKAERKSGLFASLTASLSAARSGIQGFLEKSSPKEHRRSTQPVSTDDNEDSEDETGKLTQSQDSKFSTTVDGIDNHDEFTRQMEAKGGLMYKSTDRTVRQLSHDALPPPLSLQALQADSQSKK